MKVKDKKLPDNKECYILGTSESLEKTPWDMKGVDYLACWPVVTVPPSQGHRIDKVFELHEERTWIDYKHLIVNYKDKYPKTDIYMQRIFPGLEFAKVFPINEIQDTIPYYLLKRYFTNSIAYMVAYAIYSGYKKINLSGINLCVEEEEYSMQRSCVEAWLAYALGKEIEITIMQESALFKCPYMYGYEGHKDTQIKLVQLKETVILGLNNLKKKAYEAQKDADIQEGAVRILDHMIKNNF